MAEFLQLIPGAATKDGAIENAQGLGFPADGANNAGGWNLYVPATLRVTNPLTLRLTFLGDTNAGNAVFTVYYTPGSTADDIIFSGSTQITVVFPGIASTILSEDIDITSWVNSSTDLLTLTLGRDSDEVGDTLSATAYFFNGRTLV